MDPYFFERSNTNYTPTDEEPRIRSIRNTLQTAVASFDREIALLQERRKNHAQGLERCDRLLAPLKKVPDDVLSSIFLACCGPSESKPQTMSSDHPAVVAGHVCRAWRRLALSTAPLWSKLAIIPPSHPRDSTPYPEHPTLMEEAKVRWESRMKHIIDMTRIWICRSGACPLSIVLRLSMANASDTDPAEDSAAPAPVAPLFTALIDLACSVAFRWERIAVDIVAERVTDIDAILALKAEDFPLLHTVRLQTYVQNAIAGTSFDPPPGGFLTGTALRKLNLSVNWSALHTLRFCVQGGDGDVGQAPMISILGSLGPRELLELPSNCPRLARLACAVRYVDDLSDRAVQEEDWGALVNPPQDFGPSILLPHLQSLTFYGLEPLKDLMACIDAPNLRELYFLDNYIAEMGAPMQARLLGRFVGWVRRFETQLTHIRFSLLHLMGSDDTVTECLESLPQLVDLHLDSAVPTPLNVAQLKFLLESLAPLLSSHDHTKLAVGLCPKLRRFACTLMTKGFTESQLVGFIASRRDVQLRDGKSKIEEVHVAFGVLPEVDVRSTLEAMGLDVDRFVLRVIYPTPLSIHTGF